MLEDDAFFGHLAHDWWWIIKKHVSTKPIYIYIYIYIIKNTKVDPTRSYILYMHIGHHWTSLDIINTYKNYTSHHSPCINGKEPTSAWPRNDAKCRGEEPTELSMGGRHMGTRRFSLWRLSWAFYMGRVCTICGLRVVWDGSTWYDTGRLLITSVRQSGFHHKSRIHHQECWKQVGQQPKFCRNHPPPSD